MNRYERAAAIILSQGQKWKNRRVYESFPADRFVKSSAGCHIWTGCLNSNNGYGTVSVGGKRVYAHRGSWTHHNGPIPSGMYVCHKCDVRTCINVAHLFLGTCADNMKDMHKKGRGRMAPTQIGIGHWKASLSNDDVRAIRALRLRTGMSFASIGKQFGIQKTQARLICRRLAWSHLA